MPAPKGNDNAGDGRRWREAIRRALARSQGTIDRGLDRIADGVISAAAKGAPWAIEHVAERMDGKSIQRVESTVEVTVDVGNTDSFSDKIAHALAVRAPVTVQ